MIEFRRSLPAFKERDALLKAISENQVIQYYYLLFRSFMITCFGGRACW